MIMLDVDLWDVKPYLTYLLHDTVRLFCMTGRGALDTIPEAALVYLCEHLPQTQPHSDWIPGTLLDSHFMQRLESEQFSGYAMFAVEQDWLGGLLWYQGRPLEAWRRALGGLETRAEAYRNLLPMLEFAAVRFFGLPAAVVPCILGLTLAETVQSYEAPKIEAAQMQTMLQANQFNGAAILENGKTAQAWYFARGERLLEPPLPETFREGRLHLLPNLSKIPPSVLVLAWQEAAQNTTARAEHLRLTLSELLTKQIGVNAKPLLESNSQLLAESDPNKLQAKIEIWLEDNFGLPLVQQFRQEVEQ